MSILVDRETRLIVQGFTWKGGNVPRGADARFRYQPCGRSDARQGWTAALEAARV